MLKILYTLLPIFHTLNLTVTQRKLVLLYVLRIISPSDLKLNYSLECEHISNILEDNTLDISGKDCRSENPYMMNASTKVSTHAYLFNFHQMSI